MKNIAKTTLLAICIVFTGCTTTPEGETGIKGPITGHVYKIDVEDRSRKTLVKKTVFGLSTKVKELDKPRRYELYDTIDDAFELYDTRRERMYYIFAKLSEMAIEYGFSQAAEDFIGEEIAEIMAAELTEEQIKILPETFEEKPVISDTGN